jgi:large subunit ribosomal protein L10
VINALKLDEKKQIVQDLTERFAKASVVILTDYKGLDVPSMSDLRRRLKQAGIDYKVVKNTMMVRAAQETPIAVLQSHFQGPSAVAIGYQDPVAPAQILTKFAAESKTFAVRAGVLQGKLIDPAGIKALADLPSREVLLGQLLSVMVGTPTAFVRVLTAVPRSLLNVLNALKEKKSRPRPKRPPERPGPLPACATSIREFYSFIDIRSTGGRNG